jgi:hypothetical protein
MGTRLIQGQAVLREGRMALRRWPAHLAATIEVVNGDDAAEAHSYDILIDYLLGNNASQQPVALRAPVGAIPGRRMATHGESRTRRCRPGLDPV